MSKICVGKGITLTPLQLEEKIGRYLVPSDLDLHANTTFSICNKAIKMLLGEKYSVHFLHFKTVSYGGDASTILDYWGCDLCFVGVCKAVYSDVKIDTAEEAIDGLASFLPGLTEAYRLVDREPVETLEYRFIGFVPSIKTFSG